ncbi:AI-2E family transporter [Herminiimonas sp.]|jgi:predicted PurR-regulated permease PerM|uniref:AI-2E family transporter n=1 Tax=Herminiimonas sp. TaxID=1926289 RepID=UPI0027156CED|nr:AI-2E family transporter [Herminiimonas sp.]MDO8304491.1 AI-2E family transporter [Herminiimonas sp.]
MNYPEIRQKTFLLLLVAFSIAFLVILLPFYGAVFWAIVLAILFAPFHRKLLIKTHQRANLAALATLVICLVVVIIPLVLISISLVQEASLLYNNIRSGQINFGLFFQKVVDVLPGWMVNVLERFGLSNITALQEKLTTTAVQGSEFLTKQAISIGQNTFNFLASFTIMLYILFFLLRDGDALAVRIKQAVPLNTELKRTLFHNLTTAIRATVKGNIIVAAAQGALGGIAFWFLGVQGALLWAVLMAFLSLLPAVGAALVWVPVAVYFLLTGAIWQGVTLVAFGVLVIGLIDNILRPILVGKDTQLPDFIVLISTVGGMALLGLNGFVIGPVIAAVFITLWELFSAENQKQETNKQHRPD